mgnify:FL=1|tara:strand:- start:294 stop:446 length:153 start_codon:yes stop_codon:yes gene_type:complete
MDMMLDTIIVMGLGSLLAMWVAIVVITLRAAWDAVGYKILSLIQKLKGKL